MLAAPRSVPYSAARVDASSLVSAGVRDSPVDRYVDERNEPCHGSLAAALAKAQIELVNPEKSMVATIRADGPGRGEQIFRYAPLSSGLAIVRKTNTRSLLCKQLRSITRRESFVSRPGCAIRPENGSSGVRSIAR
jgi:hypothetical protein